MLMFTERLVLGIRIHERTLPCSALPFYYAYTLANTLFTWYARPTPDWPV